MLYGALFGIRVVLQGATSLRAYPLVVGGVALLLTLSMSLPFASILVVAVLLRRDRWKEITVFASAGSASGGLLLYTVFHHLGWNYLIEAYPDLVQSKAWIDATRWLSAYGTWALLAVAASPLPQTPALIFTAVSRLPPFEVFLALFVGKLVKYGVYAWIAATFPSRFHHLVNQEVARQGGRLSAEARGAHAR
jgi:membrane protein YqaA with SNARE-associated domain